MNLPDQRVEGRDASLASRARPEIRRETMMRIGLLHAAPAEDSDIRLPRLNFKL